MFRIVLAVKRANNALTENTGIFVKSTVLVVNVQHASDTMVLVYSAAHRRRLRVTNANDVLSVSLGISARNLVHVTAKVLFVLKTMVRASMDVITNTCKEVNVKNVLKESLEKHVKNHAH